VIRMRFYSLLVFCILAAMASGCATPASVNGLDQVLARESRPNPGHVTYRCTRGAHRGASVDYLENSLTALTAADRNDLYAFIEFDVQYSKDKKIMVYHDKRMLRLYNDLRSVGNTNSGKLEEITDGAIASYDEVMDVLHKKLNIEIKSQGDDEEDRQLVDEIMVDLKDRKREKDVMISSISRDVVIYLNQAYPDMPTGQIFWITSSTYLHFDGLTQRLFDEINDTGADYLILYMANLRNIDELLKMKPRGKTMVFWDFDDTIFMVHKDLSDRMWGTSSIRNFFQAARYCLTSLFRRSPSE
jgi:glycerophosphoryl diester phosphodiesterase